MPCESKQTNSFHRGQVRGRPDPGLRSLGRAGSRRGAQGRSHGLGLEIGQLPGLMPLLLHADDQTAQPPPITHYSGPLPLLGLAQARGGREFWAGCKDVGWRAGDLPPWGLRPRRTGQGQGLQKRGKAASAWFLPLF